MSTKSFSQSFIASTDPSSSLPSPSAPPLNLSTKKEKKLQGWQHSAAGSMGGMTGAIVTSPFDVVKTRLQSDMFRHSSDEGVRHAAEVAKKGGGGGIRGVMWQFVDTVYLIKRIGVEEGWRALYKGLGPSLVGIIPARAINFYFYPTSKVYLAKQFPNAPTEKPGQTAEDSPVIHLGAAIVAGIMTSTGTNPIWAETIGELVVKTRLQLSARKKETGAVSAKSGSFLPKPIAASAASLASQASTPVSTAAVSAVASAASTRTGLYRGLSASYLGVSEGVIQWVLYERFKRLNAATTTHLESQPLLSYIPHIVGASGGAKAVASLITYPHEVIRTRLRQPALSDGTIKYKGLLQTLKLVWVEEGVGALYGGLTAHLFRVVPNAACMFLIYELVAAKLGA
ncbi:hypothetical protein D1P53_005263 [Cryptococcus gattii VGV]|nr:hypothetical protein D1P53_005263 [Cryptococcus gattii VGV]